MRLTHMQIRDFQGIENLNIELEAPVLVVSGPNASGKTTLMNAIRFALDGGSGRVSRKMDYSKFLVREGAAKKADAMVSITLDGTVYQRAVTTGNPVGDEEPDFPAVLPYLIGATFFTAANYKERARVITQVGGVGVNRETVKAIMLEEGAEEAKVDDILVYLRGGFDAALNKAKNRVSEFRGEWQGITGERYGVTKAKGWKPDVSNVHLEKAEIDVRIKGLEKQRDAYKAQRDLLEEQGDSGIPRSGLTCGPCPNCEVELRFHQGKLYVLDGSEKEPEPNKTDDVHSLDRMVQAKNQEIGGEAAKRMALDQKVADAVKDAKKAKEAHTQLQAWQKIVDLLSPDGVRARLLAKALTPVRQRIGVTCERTGWGTVEIRDDLSVWYQGRPYDLISESERWKTDVAISEALAFVSGLKLVVFDRMDVLGPPDRPAFIKWLMWLAQELDTVIVLATLKAPPPAPSGFASLWLGPKQEKAA